MAGWWTLLIPTAETRRMIEEAVMAEYRRGIVEAAGQTRKNTS
jgi:hypothetical protein